MFRGSGLENLVLIPIRIVGVEVSESMLWSEMMAERHGTSEKLMGKTKNQNLRRGRKAGNSDFVVVTPRLRQAIHVALGSGGRRWDKKVAVSASWLKGLGYDLVEVSHRDGPSRAMEVEREELDREEGTDLTNLQRIKLKHGRQVGTAYAIVKKASIQKVIEDRKTYEDAYKFFRDYLGDVEVWKAMKLAKIRDASSSIVSFADGLKAVVGRDTPFGDMVANATTSWEQITKDKVLKMLARVPVPTLRAFVSATEGMNPDLLLEDVRRFIGKRKRLDKVSCSAKWLKLIKEDTE